ncbi:MAG: ATP synthase F1 subunit epsilon [Candidatus Omnitrophota bacterium]|jgi:F-type H+-transporting ATPase subunit epsilon
MEKAFRVSIVTPLEEVYSGEAVSLIVPAYEGYLGVLANHAPLIAQLVPGKIILRSSSKEPALIISKNGGLLEVSDNNVNIILDSDVAKEGA